MLVEATASGYDEELLTRDERERIGLSAPEVMSAHFVRTLETDFGLRKGSEADLRLLRYLLITPWQERGSKAIILPNNLLAQLTDRVSTEMNHNLRGDYYLTRFGERLGLTLDINAWCSPKHEARTLKMRVPQGLKELVEREAQLEWHEEGLIWLDGTRILNRANRKLLRDEMQKAAFALDHQGLCCVARRWLGYLNHLSPHRFTSLQERLPAVRADILRTTSGPRQQQALRVLANIWAQPQPFYRPTANSVRLYGTCENLTSLSKGWRKMLAPDWIEADLRNCHLAIGAVLWNIPEAKEFLACGKSVWPLLADAMRVDLTAETKKTMKGVFYGLFFGMRSGRRTDIVHAAFGKGAHDRFVRQPLVLAILRARTRNAKQIRQAGRAIDCFGREISTKHYKVRSIQAQMMQAVEMKLLEPALELFETQSGKHGVTCTLLQHDGFSFVPHDRGDADEWKRRLHRVVQARAVEAEIDTELEFDPPISKKN